MGNGAGSGKKVQANKQEHDIEENRIMTPLKKKNTPASPSRNAKQTLKPQQHQDEFTLANAGHINEGENIPKAVIETQAPSGNKELGNKKFQVINKEEVISNRTKISEKKTNVVEGSPVRKKRYPEVITASVNSSSHNQDQSMIKKKLDTPSMKDNDLLNKVKPSEKAVTKERREEEIMHSLQKQDPNEESKTFQENSFEAEKKRLLLEKNTQNILPQKNIEESSKVLNKTECSNTLKELIEKKVVEELIIQELVKEQKSSPDNSNIQKILENKITEHKATLLLIDKLLQEERKGEETNEIKTNYKLIPESSYLSKEEINYNAIKPKTIKGQERLQNEREVVESSDRKKQLQLEKQRAQKAIVQKYQVHKVTELGLPPNEDNLETMQTALTTAKNSIPTRQVAVSSQEPLLGNDLSESYLGIKGVDEGLLIEFNTFTPFGLSKSKQRKKSKEEFGESIKNELSLLEEDYTIIPILGKTKNKRISEKCIHIPLVCVDYPDPLGTYGLVYVEVNDYDKTIQIKNIIAKEFLIHPKSIKIFHKGIELADDLVVSLGRFSGEILFFSIAPQIARSKPEFFFEK